MCIRDRPYIHKTDKLSVLNILIHSTSKHKLSNSGVSFLVFSLIRDFVIFRYYGMSDIQNEVVIMNKAETYQKW